MPRLIVLARNSSVRQINIDGPSTSIGRAAGNRVCIDSDKVSRQHALIEWTGDRYLLTDLGSRNGTCVNNERVLDSRPLGNGDAITVGDCQLRFLYSTRMLPTAEALRLVTVAGGLVQLDALAPAAWGGERGRETPSLLP
ncbi:FHA domain-containing protein [Variovorax soli]|uniref:PSer/pThr/pTyr-binding forkhead associated (FHA) protein n=1 Tax=Variovorax soli TaxID=376815 RepID=A0ABU1NG25_9BURK|nr:FHA domain-containing protein [Variovorax soli]MDR6537413.1 pSer/pThr/pTyr-binding forkhead associated (FHA) protein [Variovorax soli]